ncbi:hypothetical protein [Rathayibacter sp. AY2B1]|uniref:hypothetical protein n=1 Tax=Rathayibacter sp. AY2B1 TaxID=2080568 RepID=UPI0011B03D62|nr:hypothetical protein [Rathayibacter sp. AY2B1]
MTEQIGIPEAAALGSERRSIAILGAGGDLTERLLLPGLGRVAELARDLELTLIGAARTPQTDEEWQSLVRRSLEAAGVAAHTVEALASRASSATRPRPGSSSRSVRSPPAPRIAMLRRSLPSAAASGIPICSVMVSPS